MNTSLKKSLLLFLIVPVKNMFYHQRSLFVCNYCNPGEFCNYLLFWNLLFWLFWSVVTASGSDLSRNLFSLSHFSKLICRLLFAPILPTVSQIPFSGHMFPNTAMVRPPKEMVNAITRYGSTGKLCWRVTVDELRSGNMSPLETAKERQVTFEFP